MINMKELGSKGGNSTKKKYGNRYYSEIGRQGGKTVLERYGKDYYRTIGKKGAETRKLKQTQG